MSFTTSLFPKCGGILRSFPAESKPGRNALYCTVLYCTLLYCTVLYCTVLYCTVLSCTVLYNQSRAPLPHMDSLGH